MSNNYSESTIDSDMQNICDKVMEVFYMRNDDFLHVDTIVKLSNCKDYEVAAALCLLKDKVRNPYMAQSYQESFLYRLRSNGLTKFEKRRKKRRELLRMIANDPDWQ